MLQLVRAWEVRKLRNYKEQRTMTKPKMAERNKSLKVIFNPTFVGRPSVGYKLLWSGISVH